MSSDDSRHDGEDADPRQGDLLELLDVTEDDQKEYRHARRS